MKAIRQRLRVSACGCALVVAAACGSSAETSSTDEGQSAADSSDVAGGCDVEYRDWQTSPYVLPFPVGDAHPVALDNCSASFHAAGRPDAFAYDFDLDVGDPVTAARAGEVTAMVDDQSDAGGGVGNLVVIDHGDETAAVYLHFTTDGVEVDVGDRVEAGDMLGASGSSGLAGYPHLHFIVVEAPGDFPYTGLPVTFSNTAPNPRGPQTGDVAEALAFP